MNIICSNQLSMSARMQRRHQENLTILMSIFYYKSILLHRHHWRMVADVHISHYHLHILILCRSHFSYSEFYR